uniref:Uncharacterized protein n=1 Tax=Enterococcus faecalis TaxID=1351 RepID=Q8GR38_ENTFL|nr:hypothetical protein [Enterococcus faecalis]
MLAKLEAHPPITIPAICCLASFQFTQHFCLLQYTPFPYDLVAASTFVPNAVKPIPIIPQITKAFTNFFFISVHLENKNL